ncbi:MAG: hypothetical protein OCD01_06270 [Fibrobacterales bacterium]
MNNTLIKAIPFCIGIFIIMGCFGEETTATNPSLSSNETSENTEESSTTDDSSIISDESSEEPINQSSTVDPVSSADNNDSSELDASSTEGDSSKDDISSDEAPISSENVTNALKDDDGNCISYKEKICFQELKPNYDENSVIENYGGEFHFFEQNFEAYETLRCEVCTDTIRHTQATLTYQKYCNECEKLTIQENIEDIITSVPVPEGVSPIFSVTFDLWGNISEGHLTYEGTLSSIDKGEAASVILTAITFSTESGDYFQEFAIQPDTTDGKFYWKQANSGCDRDECFE